MPELPEVETIVRSLRPVLTGKKIVDAEVGYAPIVGYPEEADEFCAELKGREIEDVRRRGKYIVIELAGDDLLITHLRMSGRLIYMDKDEKVEKHTHVIISLDDDHQLRFIEVRKFGRMFLIPEDEPELAKGFATLGPEPLETTVEEFKKALEGRSGMIKPLLLNQKFIAGIGNIYVDEALFMSEIHPVRKANTLTEREKELLFAAVRQVLLKGIKNRGTTKSDYVDAFGNAGENQNSLQVYGREGDACTKCGQALVKMKVGGRGTHYCPNCQPLQN